MFTIYKASAGSGKTSRLVSEYLTLTIPNPEKFKHVLAITFTNNATAEMKERIVDTLYAFAFKNVSDFDGSTQAIYNAVTIAYWIEAARSFKFSSIKFGLSFSWSRTK